jgi:hypothetical protein
MQSWRKAQIKAHQVMVEHRGAFAENTLSRKGLNMPRMNTSEGKSKQKLQ